MSKTRHHLPAEVVRHAAALKSQLQLSYRVTQELLRFRGVTVSHEAIRSWVAASQAPSNLPLLRIGSQWTPACRLVSYRGETMYLWLAVNEAGEVGEFVLQLRKNESIAIGRLKAGLQQQRKLAGVGPG